MHLASKCPVLQNGILGTFYPQDKAQYQCNPEKAHPCIETRNMMCRLSKSVKWLLRYGELSIFSRWQSSSILDLGSTFWDDLQWVIEGLYHCAKFGWNCCTGFDSTEVWIFCIFGWKMPIPTLKLSFWGIWSPKWAAIWTRPPKGTSLHRNTSYDVYIVNWCRLCAIQE